MHPVAQKTPNPWGLYDLMGTVGQWTTDALDGFGYGTGPLVDPMGVRAIGRALIPPADLLPPERSPLDYKSMVQRGGFHWVWPAYLFHGNRSSWHLDRVGPIGLRIVRTIHETD